MVNSRTGIFEPLRNARIRNGLEDYWFVSFVGEGSKESIRKFWMALSSENPFPYISFRIVENGEPSFSRPVWLVSGVLPDSGTKRFDEWEHYNYFGFRLLFGTAEGVFCSQVESENLNFDDIQLDAVTSMVALSHKIPYGGWLAALSDRSTRNFLLGVESTRMAEIFRHHLVELVQTKGNSVEGTSNVDC